MYSLAHYLAGSMPLTGDSLPTEDRPRHSGYGPFPWPGAGRYPLRIFHQWAAPLRYTAWSPSPPTHSSYDDLPIPSLGTLVSFRLASISLTPGTLRRALREVEIEMNLYHDPLKSSLRPSILPTTPLQAAEQAMATPRLPRRWHPHVCESLELAARRSHTLTSTRSPYHSIRR